MVKCLFLFDSFKGSISSLELAKLFSKEFSYSKGLPFSDGGEGFLDMIKALKDGKSLSFNIKSQSYEDITVEVYVTYNNEAYLETSQLIGFNKNTDVPLLSRTTYFLGKLLQELDKLSFSKIYISLGGSLTQDMGFHLLRSLGLRGYQDENEIDLSSLDDLFKITRLDLKNLYKFKTELMVVYDVDAYLLGKHGANPLFAKQKGGTKDDIIYLEKCFSRFQELLENYDYVPLLGDGAAGGIGYIFNHIIKSTHILGSEFALKLINYEKLQDKYDYIFTGEGCFDLSSKYNKLPYLLISKTKDINKIILIAGSIKQDVDFKHYSLYPTYEKDQFKAIKYPKRYLKQAIIDIKRELGIIKRQEHEFPLFIDQDSEVLILGSFPSIISRKKSFYYMNSSNRFYKVLTEIYHDDFSSLEAIKSSLRKNHISLYDSIESCEIENSDDNKIYSYKVSDIPSIIKNSKIKKIILNGRKSQEIFLKHFRDLKVKVYFLPSTSSRNASYSLIDLVNEYKQALFDK